MNRREFFRRTVPVVAVTVAASACGWSMPDFRSLLARVAKWIRNETRESEFVRQMRYQSAMAMRAMAAQVHQYIYGQPFGALATLTP